MQPILREWARHLCSIRRAALSAAFLVLAPFGTVESFSQEVDSVPLDSLPFDSQPVPEKDSVLEQEPVVGAKPEFIEAPKVSVAPEKRIIQKKPARNVLYLGGGENSPWFHLGVLYAIEEFGVPVDSVVGTSWGAWIGFLWAKGLAPDEIQRIMLDPAIAAYVGRDMSNEKLDELRDLYEMPISYEGIPSVRQRFNLTTDSAGRISRNKMPLSPDTMRVMKSLAKLRFQESLYRQPLSFKKPFTLQGCSESGQPEVRAVSVDAVIKSLPLWETENVDGAQRASGELCPFYALPAEDNSEELAIIAVADPFRNPVHGSASRQVLRKQLASQLQNQPGIIVRSHAIADTSYKAWIQAGFSAMEQRRSAIFNMTERKVDYKEHREDPALAWFRFTPAMDSLSSELHSSLMSYWAESDTGMAGPQNFARRVQANPAYDSLSFGMTPYGSLMVGAAVHPTVDLAVGGFGSNVLGPNVYGESRIRHVDRLEMQLVLSGFCGPSSYGIQPRIDVSRIWKGHWGLSLGFDFLKLQPLKSYNNEVPDSLRINAENRRDLKLNLSYKINERQGVFAEFLFGSRSFEIDSLPYDLDEIKTYPVSPMLHYSYRKGADTSWFAQDGFSFDVRAGFESVGYSFGIIGLVPIYWKILMDGRYSVSPVEFASFTVGASAGVERYHEDGYGYVSPKSFGSLPLDLAYRFHVQPSPWSTEWYDPELSSHEFGMIRGSGSIHGKYLGAWLFAAYMRDFEECPLAELNRNKIVVEPALRFAYRSITIYAGMNRIVDSESLHDLKKFENYTYFVRVGNYSF